MSHRNEYNQLTFAFGFGIASEASGALTEVASRGVETLGVLSTQCHARGEAFVLVCATLDGSWSSQIARGTGAGEGAGNIRTNTSRATRILLALVRVCRIHC